MGENVNTGGLMKFVNNIKDHKEASKNEKQAIRIGYYEKQINDLRTDYTSEITKLKTKYQNIIKRLSIWAGIIFLGLVAIILFLLLR